MAPPLPTTAKRSRREGVHRVDRQVRVVRQFQQCPSHGHRLGDGAGKETTGAHPIPVVRVAPRATGILAVTKVKASLNSSTIAAVSSRCEARLNHSNVFRSPLTATPPISGEAATPGRFIPSAAGPVATPVAGATRTTAACAPLPSYRP